MELPTISKGPLKNTERAERQEPGPRGMWRRRTNLEKALMGVSCVAMVACAALVGVVATSGSSSSASSYSAPVATKAEPLPQ